MAEGGGGSDSRREQGRGPLDGEQELATKMLQIQSKRFYLDVKQNRRERFLKIAEVGAGGRKSRLLMSMAASREFKDHLSEFADFYTTLGPPTPENVPADGRLKSEVMVKENRRYYLDLKENNRGRFLRVTQTVARGGGPRSQIALPAQGIGELRDALNELVEEFGKEEGVAGVVPGFQGQLPESRQIRSENKMFYFDVGQNNRGVFLRISEVKANFRTSVTIPERSWTRFRDYFVEVCDKMATQPESETGAASTSSSSGEQRPAAPSSS